MSRIIIFLMMVALLCFSARAEEEAGTVMSATGNFFGNGVETLTFLPLGYACMDEDIPTPTDDEDSYIDVYAMTDSRGVALLFNFIRCVQVPCGDIDGDGRDELALAVFGLGSWGGLRILDFRDGVWNCMIDECSTYIWGGNMEDFDASQLIVPAEGRDSLSVMVWGEVDDDPWTPVQKTFKINPHPYRIAEQISGYRDLQGNFHKVK